MAAPYLLLNHDDYKKKGSLWDVLGKFFTSEPSKPLEEEVKKKSATTKKEEKPKAEVISKKIEVIPSPKTAPHTLDFYGNYNNYFSNQADMPDTATEESAPVVKITETVVTPDKPKAPKETASIVDWMKSQGFTSTDKEYRKLLAEYYEMPEYTGTAEQNLKLLKLLRADDMKPYKLPYDYLPQRPKLSSLTIPKIDVEALKRIPPITIGLEPSEKNDS